MSFRLTRKSQVNHHIVTGVVCIALAAVVSAMASLNVALPDLARSTGATQTQLAWIIDAYSLIFAALLLPAGAIGDRYGRRRALIGGLAVFAGASAIAFTAGSANELIVLRGLLGVGAAFVMPATLSTITTTFPNEQRTRAVGIWATVGGASAVLGLVLSGILLEFFSWRSVFVVNIVVAVIAMLGAIRFVPESSHRDGSRLDKVGGALAMVGLVAIVFSIIEAPDVGWMAPRTVIGLGAGLAVLVAFVLWELRQDNPLLDPRHFRSRSLTAGSTSIFIQFFAFYGFAFVTLQYLQGVRGYSPLVATLAVLPLSGAMMPMGRVTPALVERFGSRHVGVTGLRFAGAGLVLISMIGTHSAYWLLLAGLVLLGIGMGAATIPATAAITEGLPRSQQGVGSALNDLSREVGGALGIAVVGSVLAAAYRSHLQLGAAVPPEVADKARGSFAVAVHIGGPVQSAAQSAFVDGLHYALLAAAMVAVVGATGVSVLLRARRERRPARDRVSGTPSALPLDRAGRLLVATPLGVASGRAQAGGMTADDRHPAALVGTCPTCGGATTFHDADAPSPAYYWCQTCQAGWSGPNPCDGVRFSTARGASFAGACK
jgi:EmrB/QacA subfamily drug resistance transporter